MKLRELGEFRLISDVILPTTAKSAIPSGIGDDCGFVPIPSPGSWLVLTTDCAPRPATFLLGSKDYATWGWYAVLANASDLASAGADPVAFLSSVEAPPDMSVSELTAFFEGMAEACKAFRMPNAGGNIKSAERFACHGSGIGVVPPSAGIGRQGSVPGDSVVAVGPCGRFAASFLKAKSIGLDALTAEERKTLLRPSPRLREMKILRELGCVSAASDNSDGVLGAIWSIAERSGYAIELDMDSAVPSHVESASKAYGLSPWNILFFWGDWQVICTVKRDAVEEFAGACAEHSIEHRIMGSVLDAPAQLFGRARGKQRRLRVLRNENFVQTSYAGDALSNVEHLLTASLYY